MVEKGSPRYYADRLDACYRVVLSAYVLLVALFWLYWVVWGHEYGYFWKVLAIVGGFVAAGYGSVYYGGLDERLASRYERRKRAG